MTTWRGSCCVLLLAVMSSALRIVPKSLPPPHALTTLSRFYVYGKPDNTTGEVLPAYGWGLWDSPYPLQSRVVATGMSVSVDNLTYKELLVDGEEEPPSMSWLAVMKTSDFWDHFMAYQNHSHFCCRAEDVAEGLCGLEHQLRLPPEIKDRVMMSPLVTTTLHHSRAVDAVFPLRDTGSYYLMLVNCFPKRLDHFSLSSIPFVHGPRVSGEVVVENTHGFLSGIDVPKLHLFFTLASLTGVLSLWWMLTIMKAIDEEEEEGRGESTQQQSLHTSLHAPSLSSPSSPSPPPPTSSLVTFVHNLMSLTLCLMLLECVVSYVDLSWENNSASGGSVWLKMMVCVCVSIKLMSLSTLVLSISLGVNSVIQKLPPHLKMRLTLFNLVLAFTYTVRVLTNYLQYGEAGSVMDTLDGTTTTSVREFFSHLTLAGGSAAVMSFLCALPYYLTCIAGVAWWWCNSKSTIEKCRESKLLFYKQVMLMKIKRVVLLSLAVLLFSRLIQSFTATWKTLWIFTHALPNYLFLLITTAIAIIIRPSIQQYQEKKLTNVMKGLNENLALDSVEVLETGISSSAHQE